MVGVAGHHVKLIDWLQRWEEGCGNGIGHATGQRGGRFLMRWQWAAVLDFIYSGLGLGVRWVLWMALAGVA